MRRISLWWNGIEHNTRRLMLGNLALFIITMVATVIVVWLTYLYGGSGAWILAMILMLWLSLMINKLYGVMAYGMCP